MSRQTATVLLAGGLACLGWSAFAVTDQALFPNWSALVPVTGTLMALGAGASLSGRWNPLMAAPLTRVGDWSYSWYLWHWPFVTFAAQVMGGSVSVTLAAAGLSLLPAALSYRFVEQPLRLSRRIGTRGSYGLLAGLVVATLAVGGVAERAVHFGWGQPWSMGAHAAMQRDCDSQPVDFDACTWNADASGGSVLVVGDSQAWALADGVIASASALGLSTTVATMNGCPFMDPATAARVTGDTCAASIVRTMDFIRRRNPKALVGANAEGYAPAALEGYGRLMAALPAGGRQVVIVRQPPGGDQLSGRRSILVNRSGPSRTSPVRPPEPALTAALADLPDSVEVLDPRATLCSGALCDVAVDSAELYSNSNHLSVAGALRLQPQLTRVLALSVARPSR